MKVTTTRQLAEFVCAAPPAGLAPEVIDYAKVLALSHVGMTLAGACMPVGSKVTQYIRDKAATPQAGVFGAGYRSSVDFASLANGNSAHATELEDVGFPETMYLCGHWPAVFALAEQRRSSGKELLYAMVVGYEVSARLGLAFRAALRTGRAPYAALAAFGNAASTAKLLGLSVEQTAHALSLAASQAAGLRGQTGTGAHAIEAGLAARNGVCAAELAALGFTGSTTIIEGRDGFGDVWANCPELDMDFGDDLRIMHVSIKKYPCWFVMHRNIDAILDMISAHQLRWEDVESVTHVVNRTVSESFRSPQQPGDEEEARFSFAHCTAACFFEGTVFMSSFTMERVLDERWRDARCKVHVEVSQDIPAGTFETYECPVTIKLKDGRQFSRTCWRATGDPHESRFGVDDVMKKFNQCIDFSGKFSDRRARQIAESTLALDRIDDILAFADMLTYPDQLHNAMSRDL